MFFFSRLRTCRPGTLQMPPCSCSLPPRPKQPATKAHEGCQEARQSLRRVRREAWPSPASALYGRRKNFLAGFEPAARAPSKCLVQLQPATKAEAAYHQQEARRQSFRGTKKSGKARLRPCAAANVIFSRLRTCLPGRR